MLLNLKYLSATFALGGALAMLFLSGCNRGAGAAPMQRPPAVVNVAAAVAEDVPVYLDEIGRCAPRESVMVMPQVAGKITQINFADGADVKKGDLLFTIDPRPFQASLDEAKATLEQRKAELTLAQREFERTEKLIGDKSVSQLEYDQKRLAVSVSEAQVNAANANVDTAQLDLDYCKIRSPIDGRVGQRMIDAGNVVKANEGQLLLIQRLDPIYVNFTIAERDLPSVRKHMTDNSLKVQAWVPGQTEDPREGKLTFLDTAVQAGAGTVRLQATLENADRHFWAGQYVQVRLVLEVKKGAILVPATCVQVGQAGPFVYVVDGKSLAQQRSVVPGQRQGDRMVIEQGVKAGEEVIRTGHMAVMPGGPVVVAPDPPAPPKVVADSETELPKLVPPATAPTSAPSTRESK